MQTPLSGPPLPKEGQSPFLTQDQLPLLWIFLKVQQPKPDHPPAKPLTACQHKQQQLLGHSSWTEVISEVLGSTPSQCPPMHWAPHSHELTTSFLTH